MPDLLKPFFHTWISEGRNAQKLTQLAGPDLIDLKPIAEYRLIAIGGRLIWRILWSLYTRWRGWTFSDRYQKYFFFHCGYEWWESRVSAWRSTAPPGGAIDEISWKERMRGKNPWSVCVRRPTRTDCRTPQEALNQEALTKEPQEETSETSSLQSINVSNCSVLLWKAVFQH